MLMGDLIGISIVVLIVLLLVFIIVFIFLAILGYGLGGLIMGFGLAMMSFLFVFEAGSIIGVLLYLILWVIGFPILFLIFFVLGVFKYRRAKLDNPEDPFGENSINEIDK